MKFSNDAMRDVLLFIEEDAKYYFDKHGDLEKTSYTIDNIIENQYFTDLFKKHHYTEDELRHTIEKMIEGNILQRPTTSQFYYEVSDISFYGCQILELIREDDNWSKATAIAKKVGNGTIQFIKDTLHDMAVESAKTATAIAITKSQAL